MRLSMWGFPVWGGVVDAGWKKLGQVNEYPKGRWLDKVKKSTQVAT